jgi:hypothetical protein
MLADSADASIVVNGKNRIRHEWHHRAAISARIGLREAQEGLFQDSTPVVLRAFLAEVRAMILA